MPRFGRRRQSRKQIIRVFRSRSRVSESKFLTPQGTSTGTSVNLYSVSSLWQMKYFIYLNNYANSELSRNKSRKAHMIRVLDVISDYRYTGTELFLHKYHRQFHPREKLNCIKPIAWSKDIIKETHRLCHPLKSKTCKFLTSFPHRITNHYFWGLFSSPLLVTWKQNLASCAPHPTSHHNSSFLSTVLFTSFAHL